MRQPGGMGAQFEGHERQCSCSVWLGRLNILNIVQNDVVKGELLDYKSCSLEGPPKLPFMLMTCQADKWISLPASSSMPSHVDALIIRGFKIRQKSLFLAIKKN